MGTIIIVIVMLVMFAFLGLIIASMWKVMTKAGEPGWAALVPFYNIVVLARITDASTGLLIACLIPYVNCIGLIFLNIKLAKVFGKSTGFGLGLAFMGFIFFPILAFGDAEYQGLEDYDEVFS